jgi:hypothetical protein
MRREVAPPSRRLFYFLITMQEKDAGETPALRKTCGSPCIK